MKQIPLHNRVGDLVAYALVDDEDYFEAALYRWSFSSDGYAQRGIRNADGRLSSESLHVFLKGRRPGYTIDHINRNKLDCRRSNLRWATASQQGQNREAWGLSEFNGISWDNDRGGSWRARITVDGRTIRIPGRYQREEDAARAYDRKAIELFGEFAKTNFPLEDYADTQIGGR